MSISSHSRFSSKTKKQWSKQFCQLRRGAVPTEHLMPNGELLELYSADQVQAKQPTRLQRATRTYEACFLDQADQQRWLAEYVNQDGDTRLTTEFRDAGQHGQFVQRFKKYFSLSKHLNGTKTAGTYCGQATRCLDLDLDWHGKGDPAQHCRRVDLLLTHFVTHHASLKPHLQKSPDGSCHIYMILPQAWSLERLRCWLVPILEGLHAQQPDLGLLTGAGELGFEVFPLNKKQVRLPLRYDRLMILDRPLGKVPGRTKVKGKWQPIDKSDLVSYADWLSDPQAPPCNVALALAAVTQALAGVVASGKPAKATRSKQRRPATCRPAGTAGMPCLKGQLRIKDALAFWKGERCLPDSLNQHVGFAARLAYVDGLDQAVAIAKVTGWTAELVDQGAYEPTRNWRTLAGDIAKSIKRIYETKNGGQPAPEQSTKTLQRSLERLRYAQVCFWDKTSWQRFVPFCAEQLAPAPVRWSEQQLAQLCQLADVLCCDTVTARLAVELVFAHLQRQPELALTMIPALLRGLDIAWGHRDKVVKFRQLLVSYGWLRLTHKYINGLRGNAYVVGASVLISLTPTNNTTTRIYIRSTVPTALSYAALAAAEYADLLSQFDDQVTAWHNTGPPQAA